MLYLISGSSRAGKSIIAKKILQQRQIPYMSLDWLVMGFTNGLPDYGIHDKLFPHEIAEKFWPFLRAMCESMLWSQVDYVIEGEAILPELIQELLAKHPDSVKVCFVGYCACDVDEKVSEVKRYSTGKNDWLSNESDATIYSHINNMVAYSKRIKADCEKYSLAYFDTSDNFESTTDQAKNYLLNLELLDLR